MNVRNPGRGRQVRRERPFKERHLDSSVDSTRSTSASRHESRGGEIGKPRKHRENKPDENRSRDKNYETIGKLSAADFKDRGKPESGRRPDKGGTREKNNALIQGRDGYRELSKGRI